MRLPRVSTEVTYPAHVRAATCWPEMEAIHRPAYNLALWHRAPDEPITAWLAQAAQSPIPAIRALLTAEQVSSVVYTTYRPLARDTPEVLARWAEDVAGIVLRFGRLTGQDQVRVRIERVDQDMCCLFHADQNHLRLLCTYLGPGTEWVGHGNVRWDRVQESSNEARIKDLNQVYRIPPFGVAVLKGGLYPDNPWGGLIHRSPPVAAQQQVRVMLRLDPHSYSPGYTSASSSR